MTALRTRAARKLEKGVEAELASLAMERTTFRIEMGAAPWSAAGADRVEFLVSPNLGEEPKPLEKVASGGEISRIALALKTCLSEGVPPHARWFSTKWMRASAAARRKAWAAAEEAGGREPGALRDAPGADRVVRGSSLLRGEAREPRAHGGGD